MALALDAFRKILDAALTAQPQAIGCDECLEQLGHYAEQVLTDQPISRALHRLQDHLEDCTDCEEEFQMLLTAMRGLNSAL